jgi:hypothetical protein
MKTSLLVIIVALCLTSCADKPPGPPVRLMQFDPVTEVLLQINATSEAPIRYEIAWDGSTGSAVESPITLHAKVTGAGGYQFEFTDPETGRANPGPFHPGNIVKLRGEKKLLPFMRSRREEDVTIFFQHAFLDSQGAIIFRLTVFEERN